MNNLIYAYNVTKFSLGYFRSWQIDSFFCKAKKNKRKRKSGANTPLSSNRYIWNKRRTSKVYHGFSVNATRCSRLVILLHINFQQQWLLNIMTQIGLKHDPRDVFSKQTERKLQSCKGHCLVAVSKIGKQKITLRKTNLIKNKKRTFRINSSFGDSYAFRDAKLTQNAEQRSVSPCKNIIHKLQTAVLFWIFMEINLKEPKDAWSKQTS